jgi:hypothetical protein
MLVAYARVWRFPSWRSPEEPMTWAQDLGEGLTHQSRRGQTAAVPSENEQNGQIATLLTAPEVPSGGVWPDYMEPRPGVSLLTQERVSVRRGELSGAPGGWRGFKKTVPGTAEGRRNRIPDWPACVPGGVGADPFPPRWWMLLPSVPVPHQSVPCCGHWQLTSHRYLALERPQPRVMDDLGTTVLFHCFTAVKESLCGFTATLGEHRGLLPSLDFCAALAARK